MEAHISLMELFDGLHDPCRRQGARHLLPALLALAVVAMLIGVKKEKRFLNRICGSVSALEDHQGCAARPVSPRSR
jgi:hypothetical protein